MADVTKRLPFEFSSRWSELLRDFDPAIPGAWQELATKLDLRDRELENYLSNQPMVYSRDSGVTDFRSHAWTAKTYSRIKSWSVEVDQLDDGSDDVQDVDVDLELHVDGSPEAFLTLPAGEPYIDYEGRLPTLGPGARVTIYCEQTGFALVSTVGF